MIGLEYEMTYTETIEGPLGPTSGSPLGERLCWQVTTATLPGPRINATLAMPGTDWIRLGPDGFRRQDLRAQLLTNDGEVILFRYELALIRPSERFLAALASCEATEFDDQYMWIAPHFEVVPGGTRGLERACSSAAAGSRVRKQSRTSSTWWAQERQHDVTTSHPRLLRCQWVNTRIPSERSTQCASSLQERAAHLAAASSPS
jgi:hypothetical protein